MRGADNFFRQSDVFEAVRGSRDVCMCHEKNLANFARVTAHRGIVVDAALLREVSDLLAHYIDELGECDHSVNVCRCGVTRIADDLRVALGDAVRCAVCHETKAPADLIGGACAFCAVSILAESAEEDASNT